MLDSFKSDKRLFTWEEAHGRTLVDSKNYSDSARLLIFEGGYFLYVEAVPGRYDEGKLHVCRHIQMYDALQLSLITEAEYLAYQAERDEYEKQRKAESDKREYDRLKKEFEASPAKKGA